MQAQPVLVTGSVRQGIKRMSYLDAHRGEFSRFRFFFPFNSGILFPLSSTAWRTMGCEEVLTSGTMTSSQLFHVPSGLPRGHTLQMQSWLQGERGTLNHTQAQAALMESHPTRERRAMGPQAFVNRMFVFNFLKLQIPTILGSCQ